MKSKSVIELKHQHFINKLISEEGELNDAHKAISTIAKSNWNSPLALTSELNRKLDYIKLCEYNIREYKKQIELLEWVLKEENEVVHLDLSDKMVKIDISKEPECTEPERYAMMVHMNEIMKSMSNENAYYNNWVCQVPDEATENELKEIAEDEDMFSSTCDVFFGICSRYGKSGAYVPKATK